MSDLNPQVARTKLKLRQPSTDPTSLAEAQFVILGGPDAGIRTLTEYVFFSIMRLRALTTKAYRHSDVPPAASAGPCPPLSVLCRSYADAEKVWQLQPMIKVIERRSRTDVAAALMMNIVVRGLFADDQTVRFHAAFLGFFNRPVVYFSW